MNLAGLRRVLAFLEREYDVDETLAERIRKAREYVDARLHRAEVVDELPVNAPPGKLIVTPGSTSLSGPNRPLREIPTQPLP